MRILTCLAVLGAMGAALATPSAATGATILPIVLAQSTSQAPAETNDEKADPNAVECRRVKVTGSRIKRKRICMTLSQWEEQGRQSRGMATDIQDAGTIDPAGDPGM